MSDIAGIESDRDVCVPLNGVGAERLVPRWSRKVVMDVLGVVDIVMILASSFLTLYIHNGVGIHVFGGDYFAIQIALVAAGITRFMMLRNKMYDQISLADFPVNPVSLAAAFGTGLFVVCSILLAFDAVRDFHVGWFSLWYVSGLSFLIGWRSIARIFLKKYVTKGHFRSNLAVYGGGYISRKLHDHLLNEQDGIRFLGVFDDRQDETRLDSFGLKISGTLEDLMAVGREGSIDQIIIALPQSAERRINDIVGSLEQLPVHIHVCTHVSSDIVDAALRGRNVHTIGPVGLLNVKRKPLSDWGPLLKKMEDYVMGGLLLLLGLPIFVIAAIAIKATSRGPVFFIQKRHGLNHKIINVYKFRTMTTLENGKDVKQAEKNDARVTSVGWLLRRTSLDELPQVLNVLKGEMSLVGPRPHALVQNEEYGARLERYSNRHQVKPGITGWAQVNGFRGETKDHNLMKVRVMHDLHYITNWTFWLDMKIILMTPIYGLINKNAY